MKTSTPRKALSLLALASACSEDAPGAILGVPPLRLELPITLARDAALTEVLRVQDLATARYQQYRQSMSIPQREADDDLARVAHADGAALHVAWSHRGTVQSLWGYSMRIPVAPAARLSAQDRARQFLMVHGALFGLTDPSQSLVLRRSRPSYDGRRTVVRFDQSLWSASVFGAGLVVHVGQAGDIEWVSGHVVPEAAVLPAQPALGVKDAAAMVGGDATTAALGWFDPEIFRGGQAAADPVRLVWQVFASAGLAGTVNYVDALTGSVLATLPLTQHHEHREIFCAGPTCNLTPPGQLQYDDVCHSGCTESWSCVDCPLGYCSDAVCRRPLFGGTSGAVATNTHLVYDYFFTRHLRDSWDNALCGTLNASCVYPQLHRMRASSDVNDFGFCNAAWCPYNGLSCGGQRAQIITGSGAYCLDIVGHEFAHGVNSIERGIGETPHDCLTGAALSEGFSDAFGELIEKYATGSTNWQQGPCSTCPAIRSLSNPPSSSGRCLCSGGFSDGLSRAMPDHVSMYHPWCGGHWNSTISSKVAYLLGRDSSEGGSTHWGFTVTGIGEPLTSRVFYSAFVDTGMHVFADFTTFGQAIADACLRLPFLPNILQCFAAMHSVGVWSAQQQYAIATDPNTPMALSRWTVSGVPRNYIFYKAPGPVVGSALRYRYRTDTGAWSAEAVMDSGGSGPSAAVLPGVFLLTCFHNSLDGIWCDSIDGSGQVHIGPDPVRQASAMGEPSLVYRRDSGGDKLYLAYRAPSDGRVFWQTYSVAAGWTAAQDAGFLAAAPPVLASGSEDYWAPNHSTLWIVYPRTSDGRIAYRAFAKETVHWGPERLAGNGEPAQHDFTAARRLGAAVFRGRLHVAYARRQPSGSGLLYMSCRLPCASNSFDWTRWNYHLAAGSEPGVATLENYGTSDGWLYAWFAPGSRDYQVARASKYGE